MYSLYDIIFRTSGFSALLTGCRPHKNLDVQIQYW